METRFGQVRAARDAATPRRSGLAHRARRAEETRATRRRNRIKRRLRAGFADARLAAALGDTHLGWADAGGGGLGADFGVDVGVFPSKAVLDMNFDILVTQLGSAVPTSARKLRPRAV